MEITDIMSFDFAVNASLCLIYLTLTITGVIFVVKAKTISKTILTGVIVCFILEISFNILKNMISGVLLVIGVIFGIIVSGAMSPLIACYISDTDKANRRY